MRFTIGGGEFATPTRIAPGDELVIGLVRNEFWFRRPRSLWSRLPLRVRIGDTLHERLVAGQYGEIGENFGAWVARGLDPIDLIEAHHRGMLALHTFRWEEVNGLVVHLTRRVVFRAVPLRSRFSV